jgi:hypothetical protein
MPTSSYRKKAVGDDIRSSKDRNRLNESSHPDPYHYQQESSQLFPSYPNQSSFFPQDQSHIHQSFSEIPADPYSGFPNTSDIAGLGGNNSFQNPINYSSEEQKYFEHLSQSFQIAPAHTNLNPLYTHPSALATDSGDNKDNDADEHGKKNEFSSFSQFTAANNLESSQPNYLYSLESRPDHPPGPSSAPQPQPSNLYAQSPYNPYHANNQASSNQPIYSLNPSYYNHKAAAATDHFHSQGHSFHHPGQAAPPSSSKANQRNKPTAIAVKPIGNVPNSGKKKMERAQQMLLYGVLHDVLDSKRTWERNLRR